MEVFSVVDGHNVDSIKYLAVAVRRYGLRAEQLHTGLLFRGADKDMKLLHVGSHLSPLIDETISPSFIWLDSALDEKNQKVLQTMCAMVEISHGAKGLPYGLGGELAEFDFNGRLTTPYGEEDLGFTCATFVLALFQSTGFDLIDYSSWKQTPVDKTWQIQVAQYLGQLDKNYAHAQRMRSARGASRYRPDQVAAAVALSNPPHCKEAVKDGSRYIRESTNIVLKTLNA